jgi:hypothetical protein
MDQLELPRDDGLWQAGLRQADQSGLNRVLAAAQKLQTQACCHLVPLHILLKVTVSERK